MQGADRKSGDRRVGQQRQNDDMYVDRQTRSRRKSDRSGQRDQASAGMAPHLRAMQRQQAIDNNRPDLRTINVESINFDQDLPQARVLNHNDLRLGDAAYQNPRQAPNVRYYRQAWNTPQNAQAMAGSLGTSNASQPFQGPEDDMMYGSEGCEDEMLKLLRIQKRQTLLEMQLLDIEQKKTKIKIQRQRSAIRGGQRAGVARSLDPQWVARGPGAQSRGFPQELKRVANKFEGRTNSYRMLIRPGQGPESGPARDVGERRPASSSAEVQRGSPVAERTLAAGERRENNNKITELREQQAHQHTIQIENPLMKDELPPRRGERAQLQAEARVGYESGGTPEKEENEEDQLFIDSYRDQTQKQRKENADANSNTTQSEKQIELQRVDEGRNLRRDMDGSRYTESNMAVSRNIQQFKLMRTANKEAESRESTSFEYFRSEDLKTDNHSQNAMLRDVNSREMQQSDNKTTSKISQYPRPPQANQFGQSRSSRFSEYQDQSNFQLMNHQQDDFVNFYQQMHVKSPPSNENFTVELINKANQLGSAAEKMKRVKPRSKNRMTTIQYSSTVLPLVDIESKSQHQAKRQALPAKAQKSEKIPIYGYDFKEREKYGERTEPSRIDGRKQHYRDEEGNNKETSSQRLSQAHEEDKEDAESSEMSGKERHDPRGRNRSAENQIREVNNDERSAGGSPNCSLQAPEKSKEFLTDKLRPLSDLMKQQTIVGGGQPLQQSQIQQRLAGFVQKAMLRPAPPRKPELDAGPAGPWDPRQQPPGVPTAGPQGGAIQGDVGAGTTQKDFFQPLSYRKLMKMITTEHPVDLDSKTSFSAKERITVKDYVSKITDCFYCYAINQKLQALGRALRKRFFKDGSTKFVKPESLSNLPDSGSSSADSEEQVAQGLTQCSIALGTGAALYLQMTKTFAIMFAILAVLNVPLYVLYEQNTTGNDYFHLKKTFKIFTLGNLGQMDLKCDWSDLKGQFPGSGEKALDIFVDCGEDGYIAALKGFGFLYKFDQRYGANTNGTALCEFVEDPLITYKYQAPGPPCDPAADSSCVAEAPLSQEERQRRAEEETQKREAERQAIEEQKRIQHGGRTIQEVQKDVKHEVEEHDNAAKGPAQNQNGGGSNRGVDQEDDEPKEENLDNLDGGPTGKEDDSIGILPDEEQRITPHNIDPLCEYVNSTRSLSQHDNLFSTAEGERVFEQYFKDFCYYSQKCVLDVEELLWQAMSEGCKERVEKDALTSRAYVAIVGCKFDDVVLPIVGTRMHKEQIGLVIVLGDALSIVIMIYFFQVIKSLNNEYIRIMDNMRVQMMDFGVKIDNVKLDRYTQDSRLIKMKVWLHFTKVLELDERRAHRSNTDVIDVCLSLYTQPSIQLVFRMQEIQLDINDINNKLYAGLYKEDQVPDKLDELKMLQEKQKRFEDRYRKLIARKPIKHGANLTVQKIPKSQRISEIQYIFVIFKDCDATEFVLPFFEREGGTLNTLKNAISKQASNTALFGRPLNVVPILEPDQIIWENLAYTGDEQKLRRIIMQVISLVFLIGTTLFTMYLGGIKGFVNHKIPGLHCPDVEVTKMQAYEDEHSEKSSNLMGCYCSQETSLWQPWSLIPHDFSDVAPDDPKKYCLTFWGMQYLKEAILFFISTSAVFINEAVSGLFQSLGEFQKKHTKIEEQEACFRQIFVMEFINMGIIVLFTSFDKANIHRTLLGRLAQKHPIYFGYEPNWYMSYGNQICIFIFMSTWLVNVKECVKYTIRALARTRDRSFKSNLKLDPDDEDCDKPNTKLRVQSDLEALYTGAPFKGEKAYSRMMSTLFVILMYSGGMPILYFIGLVFYLVTFYVNKFLLIKFYKKSRTLTRTVPLFSMRFLKVGLVLHMLNSLFMLHNPVPFYTKNREHGLTPVVAVNRLFADFGVDLENEGAFSMFLRTHTEFLHQQVFLVVVLCFIVFYMFWSTTSSCLRITGACLGACLRRACGSAEGLMPSLLSGWRSSERPAGRKSTQRIVDERAVGEEPGERDQPPTRRHREGDERDKRIVVHEAKELFIKQAGSENGEADSHDPGHDHLEDGHAEEHQHDPDVKCAKRMIRPDYSDNIIQEFNIENLSNFYQRSKKELADFWDLFQWNDLIDDKLLSPGPGNPNEERRQLFYETCYTYRISEAEVLQYQAFLLSRIAAIEKTITHYFDLIKPVIVNKMREKFARDRKRRRKTGTEGTLREQLMQRKYEEWHLVHSDEVQFDNEELFPFEKQLIVLQELQEDLIIADKERKDNRRGVQEICRMTGSLTQSYFVFDSQNYKIGRKIFYGMAAKEETLDDDVLSDLGSMGLIDRPAANKDEGPPSAKKGSTASVRGPPPQPPWVRAFQEMQKKQATDRPNAQMQGKLR